MKLSKQEKNKLAEQDKKDRIAELNVQVIDLNHEEAELKKNAKETEDPSETKTISVRLLKIHDERLSLKKRIHQLEIGKFKNFFRIKRKYMELMYSPTRSSILFRLLIVTVAAFVVTFGLHFFIHRGDVLYTGGLRTVQQIILYATKGSVPSWATYLIFFGMNVPLAYFGWKYIGKWFTILTLYFLVIQAGFDELLSIGYFEAHLKSLYIITDATKAEQVYLSAFVGAIIYGFGVALTFVAGASSGGTKFIVAWLQKKYGMSLGKGSVVIAVFMIALGLLINGIILGHNNFFEVYFSTATFATAAFIVVQALIQNWFAPRTKKTTINIVTTHLDKVVEVIDSTILSKRVWYTYKIKKNKDRKQSSVVVLTVDRRESKFILGKLTRRLPSSQITYFETNLHSDKFVVRGFD